MDEIKCPICGLEMVIINHTPLCIKCDPYEVYEMNAFIKYDLQKVKK